ncbi:hypothetical protein Cgig2_027482 [Carnegiea gigantea]|uniref:Ubiquitin-like protease family profile domain-containing protein n=1 Tax=Carnegiea gigantea TaxID=171969 RepID=A0A9Q1QNG8_9CARY|nr:hypothetical protein Cgig2_027482 [Carnegiea gigantea]
MPDSGKYMRGGVVVCLRDTISLRLTCALTLTDREEDLQECLPKLMPASWLRGLIHVVPKAGAGDRSGKYCIGNLTMDMFTELLHKRQGTYPNLCWMSVTLYNKGRISGIIWDSFKATPQSDIRYVFMPLLETSDGHWLLLVVDLREHFFLVYDSLSSQKAKSRRELVDTVRIALLLVFLRSTTYADAGQWDVVIPKCPEQRKYV